MRKVLWPTVTHQLPSQQASLCTKVGSTTSFRYQPLVIIQLGSFW